MARQGNDGRVPADGRRKPRNTVRLVFPPTGLNLPAPTVRALIDEGLARLIASRVAHQSDTVGSSAGRQDPPTTPLSTLGRSLAVTAKMQSGWSPKPISQMD